jgi:hypothetical protein
MSETSVRIICQDLTAIDRNILGLSIGDMNGQLLSSSSNEPIKRKFGINLSEKHYGMWAKIIIQLVQEAGQDFGHVKAIVNFHMNGIFELVPVTSRQLIIGLVLSRSTNADFITSKIFDLLEGNDKVQKVEVRNLREIIMSHYKFIIDERRRQVSEISRNYYSIYIKQIAVDWGLTPNGSGARSIFKSTNNTISIFLWQYLHY